jgi:hypothetical protein
MPIRGPNPTPIDIPTPSRVDNTIVKAIVRAHRWRDMLESGRHATVRDLAKARSCVNENNALR